MQGFLEALLAACVGGSGIGALLPSSTGGNAVLSGAPKAPLEYLAVKPRRAVSVPLHTFTLESF